MPQWQYIYNMISPLCSKVMVSCNATQSAIFPFDIEKIVDDFEFGDIGPMTGLMSAFKIYPEKSFLFIGCDYPFINEQDIQSLCNAGNESKVACAIMNDENIYEPLLAMYRPATFELLKQNHRNNKYSLHFFLEEVEAVKVIPSSKISYLSVDTIEQYVEAKRMIEK